MVLLFLFLIVIWDIPRCQPKVNQAGPSRMIRMIYLCSTCASITHAFMSFFKLASKHPLIFSGWGWSFILREHCHCNWMEHGLGNEINRAKNHLFISSLWPWVTKMDAECRKGFHGKTTSLSWALAPILWKLWKLLFFQKLKAKQGQIIASLIYLETGQRCSQSPGFVNPEDCVSIDLTESVEGRPDVDQVISGDQGRWGPVSPVSWFLMVSNGFYTSGTPSVFMAILW